MLEMDIDSIRVSLINYQRVVILKVKDSTRFLPIWIGSNEADSIAMKLQEVEVPRPLTHDLLGSVITTLGAAVSRIVVSDLSDDTFFAKIELQVNGNTMEVDCRPSDAIALAVRTGAPIFAADTVVEKAGVEMDESGQPVVPTETTPEGKVEPRPVTPEEARSLSAFTEFIDKLDLDDIGQETPGEEETTEKA